MPTLLLSFGMASGLFSLNLEAQNKAAQAPAPTPAPLTMSLTGHSFWRHPDCDAVVEVWTDPMKGLRGKNRFPEPCG